MKTKKAAKKTPKTATKKAARKRAKPARLAGGNPQIAMGDGDAPVQAYLEAMPGWKREVGRQLDSLISAAVPQVRKAVKWNSPFYGMEALGWFVSFHCYTDYVKVAFLSGGSLKPRPPGESTQQAVRYLDIHKNEAFDAKRFSAWAKQASRLPGWGKC